MTNFAVLVSYTNANLKSVANGGHVTQDDGGDIRFHNAADTQLSHEIEKYVATNGNLIAWVKVPSISSNTDFTLNMYYGSAEAGDQWNATNTWETNAMMVQHFNETSGGINYDSTAYTNHGTIIGASLITTGQVDGADSFDAIDDYVNAGNGASLDITNTVTVTVWIFYTGASRSWILSRDLSSSYGYQLGIESSRKMTISIGNGSGYNVVTANEVEQTNVWTHIAATYIISASNITSVALFRNGTLVKSGPILRIINNGVNAVLIGSYSRFGTYWFNGLIDELRIHNRALSLGEITAQYNNQVLPSAFYSVGAEQQRLNKGTIISVCLVSE